MTDAPENAPRDLASLTWPDLQDRLDAPQPPVVFLVLGATEAHGPHLPLDTDTVLGLELARRTAVRLEAEIGIPGLIAPPFTTTAATCAQGFPGTISVPRATETAALLDTLEELLEAGVRNVCLITLHFDPDHLAAVRDAVDGLPPEAAGAVAFPDLTKKGIAQRIGGEFATGDCHAGCFETSLMMACAPDRVDPVYAELEVNEVGLVQGIREGKRSFVDLGMPQAYCGAPAEATAERGEELFETMAGLIVEACRGAWGGD